MELCECGDYFDQHQIGTREGRKAMCACRVCTCPKYEPRRDPRYDPDDAHDIGYSDEGFPYSGLGKVRR
jgi:hypothetical protein